MNNSPGMIAVAKESKGERGIFTYVCRFLPHGFRDGAGNLLVKVLVWFEDNGLFTVLLYLHATWEVQQPGP